MTTKVPNNMLEKGASSVVDVEDFGDVTGGADATAAYIKALATGRTVRANGGIHNVSGEQLVVNLGIQSLITSAGTRLRAPTLSGTQRLLRLTNNNGLSPSDFAAPSAIAHCVQGFTLTGEGENGNGSSYGSSTVLVENNTSHSGLRDCFLYGAGKGATVFTEGYIQTYDRVNIGQCGVGFEMAGGGNNYGERISFTNGAIYDCGLGIRNNCQTGAFQATNSSFDYSLKFLETDNAAVNEFHNCWIECNDAGSGKVQATLAGASTYLQVGGRIQQNGTPGALAQLGFFNTSADSSVTLRDVFLFNLRNTANVLDAGSGLVLVSGTKSYAVSYIPGMISAVANSLLADGGFENANISDNWYIYEDTAAITNKYVGANISISNSTDVAYTGARSLKIVKTNAGSAGSFALFIPIPPGSRAAMSLFYTKPATGGGGTVFVNTLAAHVEGILPSGVPNVLIQTSIDPLSMPFTSAATGWTPLLTGMDRVLPSWANGLIIYGNAVSFSGIFYIDLVRVAKT